MDYTDIFYQIIVHVHFREILSGYFLFSRFNWSIFVTQLVAKHMKEIIFVIYSFPHHHRGRIKGAFFFNVVSPIGIMHNALQKCNVFYTRQ
jgi:hypothetical protein